MVISPTCEVRFPEGPIAKGPELVLGYLIMVFRPTSVPLSKVGCQWCVASQVSLTRSEKWDFFERPLPLAQLMLSLSMDTVTEDSR